MPKSLNKTKGTQKRKRTPNNSTVNTESDGSESKPGPKKRKTQNKRNFLSDIAMSKQFASEVQNKRKGRPRKSTNKDNEPRLCGNGAPMPPLAVLEVMYADSDDENPPNLETATTTERCTTPETKPVVHEENINSPKTLEKITSRVIDLICKTVVVDLIFKTGVIDDEFPRLPVKPQKRPKKSGIPYIVGCKERPQVPWAPKTKFCVGSEDYGVEENQSTDEEDSGPKKRRKRGTKINLSKSIFNAKSDEIAERVKQNEIAEQVRNSSPDSNKTIEYDFPSTSPTRSFSPLPSTSRDNETILKNDKLFNESLQCDTLPGESQDDVEVIEVPRETIILDDTVTNTNKSANWQFDTTDDDCCILIEPNARKERVSESTRQTESPKDDLYSSIDLTQTFDNQVFEICDDDIDVVIAENQAILEKGRKNKRNIDTVTSVDPNVIIVEESRPRENILQSNTTPPNISNNNSRENIQTNHQVNDATGHESQHSRRIEISDVVNNFFRNNTSSSHDSDVPNGNTTRANPVASETTIMQRLGSWMMNSLTSIRNNSRPNSRQNLQQNDDIVVVENSMPSASSNNSQTSSTQISNNNYVQPIHISGSTSQPIRPRSKKRTEVNTQRNIIPEQNGSPTTEPERGRDLGECPICMDKLAIKPVASTICGHVFCMDCIKSSMKTNKRCPTCRKALKGAGYHQLFL